MRWFRRSRPPSRPDEPEEPEKPEEPIEVGGDRIVFWKAKSEEVEGEIYGPIWIADANDPDVTLEEPTEWVTYIVHTRGEDVDVDDRAQWLERYTPQIPCHTRGTQTRDLTTWAAGTTA